MVMKEKVMNFYAIIFAKSYLKKFNLLLFHLSLRGLGVLNYSNFRISGELFFVQYVKSNFSLNTIFDVGANKGDYSSNFEDLNCDTYCFEPHPKTFHELNNRFSRNQRIRTFNLGLSDSCSETLIFDHKLNDGSCHASMFEEVITGIHGVESKSTEIKLSTIDEEVKKHKIERINLLKIDTEGNELNVLKGAEKSIKQGIIDVIQIEFNEMNVVSKSFLKDFILILHDYNFYRLLPNAFLEINYSKHSAIQYELFAFQNIIAIKKELDINTTKKKS